MVRFYPYSRIFINQFYKLKSIKYFIHYTLSKNIYKLSKNSQRYPLKWIFLFLYNKDFFIDIFNNISLTWYFKNFNLKILILKLV